MRQTNILKYGFIALVIPNLMKLFVDQNEQFFEHDPMILPLLSSKHPAALSRGAQADKYGTIIGETGTVEETIVVDSNRTGVDNKNVGVNHPKAPLVLLDTIGQFREMSKLNRTMCASWDLNVDEWWLSNPDWYPSFENNSHYCFSLFEDSEKANFMRHLYLNQYEGNCSNAVYRDVLSYGWGIDFLNVIDALYFGFLNQRPVRMVAKRPWHYALPNTPKGLGAVSNPKRVCDSADMDCFFLPFSPCPPWNKNHTTLRYDIKREKKILRTNHGKMYKPIAHWLLAYTKRPQHWLRKRIAEFTDRQNVTAPCTVMHVRRGDVTLDDNGRRRYYPIEDYVKADTDIHDTVFLVTDDSNAIQEAKLKFPNISWQYIDRPRYRGAEAGFAKHTPSGGT